MTPNEIKELLTKADQMAIDELPRKLKNEKLMQDDLDEFFEQMNDEFLSFFLLTGMVIDFTQFTPEMIALLKKNYRRSARDFKYVLRDQLNLDRNTDARAINAGIALYIANHANQQARFIISGTNKEARNALFKTTSDAQRENESLTQEQIATLSAVELARRNAIRSETTAQVEVQNIAETTKQIESSALDRSGEIVAAGVVAKKLWSAVLDARTRPAHALADGQRVDIGKPFTVKGQLLMYPGDTSLGATLDNVINCRCSSQVV